MDSNCFGVPRRALAAAVLTAALLAPGLSARAQGLEEPFREPYLKALQGKVVAYLPVAMSFDNAGWLVAAGRPARTSGPGR